MKNNEKMYYVQLDREGEFSTFGFVMWTENKKYAKQYTLIEAQKLIDTIPPHIGKGALIEVENN